MKKVVLISVIILLIYSCEKQDTPYRSEGMITAYDLRECACCGGWFIEIGQEIYRFYETPRDCSFNIEDEILPLTVELDWKMEADPCLGDEIIIERIKKK